MLAATSELCQRTFFAMPALPLPAVRAAITGRQAATADQPTGCCSKRCSVRRQSSQLAGQRITPG